MTLYKVINEDGSCAHGGDGTWSLPTRNEDGIWTPGDWWVVEGELELCENGLHMCDGEEQLVRWLGAAIFEAEYDGEIVRGDDKVVVRKARLSRKFDAWNERAARLFACDCAEHVLHIFEDAYPDDTRPRQAVETARRFANGQATQSELGAARTTARTAEMYAPEPATWAVARSAAWTAAEPAPEPATWVAVRAAARAVARAAAWAKAAAGAGARYATMYVTRAWDGAAEREWQAERLRWYLSGGNDETL